MPFVAGFYSVDIGFKYFWGEDCIAVLIDFLHSLESPHIIYAHNGGKFDYLYFVDKLENPIKLINGRIAKAKLGIHELRDSYSIIPMPLSGYKKEEIDYSNFEKNKRSLYKKEICDYLESDCLYLFDLVSKFIERFGTKLTIGSTAISELKKLTEFETTFKSFDERFRPFYYGGRVENFKKGIYKGKFKVFDVNSMYPYVMLNYEHPEGNEFVQVSDPVINAKGELVGYEGETYFAVIVAKNNGALPFRDKTLNFNCEYAEFFATSHEIKVALKYKRIEITHIKTAYTFMGTMDFSGYVNKFSEEKIAAKVSGDKIAEIFAKLLLNSCYGKFGSNPANYFDYHLLKRGEAVPREWMDYDINGDYGVQNWELHESQSDFEIWKKPSRSEMFFNVATAASITGAARATLLEALCETKSPYYCDTDSIILKDAPGKFKMDDKKLGCWKLEAEGDHLALAGKKLYALMQKGECVKLASKGAKLKPSDVFALCEGKEIEWKNDAPNMKLNGETKFVKRRIKKT